MSKVIVPWIYLYNGVIRAVDQGGRRPGACTVYCRPHHTDIYEFCEMSLKTGEHYQRAHSLNFAIWFPWLFWDRVRKDQDWTLFCPAHTKKLNDIWGIEWIKQYEQYERNSSVKKTVVKARHLLNHITSIERKSGMPYIMHGDACNMKSNQKNLGYIRSGNLCLEVIQYSSDDEISACNLASISLRAFCRGKTGILLQDYDFKLLGKKIRQCVRNLNKVIDENWYPLDKIVKSNKAHRPIGIGVSGFAEMLHELDLPFQDPKNPSEPHPKTRRLNKMIFACMYWNALVESVKLAIKDGSYSSFKGSPIAEGKFQFDLWADEYELLNKHNFINPNIRKKEDDQPIDPCHWEQDTILLTDKNKRLYVLQPTWDSLRHNIDKFGLRNSLLLTVMPTASSAQPLRNGESVEAHQSNIYSRKVNKGAYPVINRYMIKDLQELSLWNRSTIDLIHSDRGSISKLYQFVLDNHDRYLDYKSTDTNNIRLKWIIEKYKTMWELSMKIFMKMAAERGRYICQSQSTNIYLAEPTDEQLRALHLYGHYLGLKTGMYYLRSLAGTTAIKFSVDPKIINYVNNVKIEQQDVKQVKCKGDICLNCQ